MAEQVSKYHHKVPQTYLKSWCFSGDSIHTYDKSLSKIEDRNIANIFGENYFYSIYAGSLFATNESLEKIFGFLKNFSISIEGKALASLRELNEKFEEYDNWEIYYPNGKIVPKKARNTIKQQILSTTDDTLEKRWSQEFENDWGRIATNLYSRLVRILSKDPDECLTYNEFLSLIRYYIMYDWRGEEGNATLNNFMNWLRESVPIFDSESNDYTTIKNFGFNDTIIEEIKHASSLKFYEQLLDNKEGMKKIYDAYAQQLTVIFLLDRDSSLFTSDNPAFELIDEDGLKKPILAITPKVLMMLARKDPEKPLSYMINRLSPKEVEYYNKQIFNHGNMIVSKRPITDSDIEKYK